MSVRSVLPLPAPVIAAPVPIRGEIPRILVVDPDPDQRQRLEGQMAPRGYDVAAVGTSTEALRAVREVGFDIVICHWRLDGRTGKALCRAIRALGGPYVYFVLLAAEADPGRIAEGLNAGADDFLVQPVTTEELSARIAAGTRLLAAQRALSAAHAETGRALAEARSLSARIERDLVEGRRLQASLMPPAHARICGVALSSALHMSGEVGGDLVGWSADAGGNLSIFAVDVMGHGVASALMAARLMGALAADSKAAERGARLHSLQPHCVAARLNALARREIGTEHYFTMLCARFEPELRRLRFVQAGHPSPLLLRADGSADFLGDGGLPVGLVDGARWQRQDVSLGPGDRLLIHSDGVTECEGPPGLLGEEGLLRLVAPLRGEAGPDLLDGVVAGLRRHSGRKGFADDVSMILLDIPA